MTDFSQADYFTDESLLADPFSYFEYLREQGPVVRLPRHDVVAVVGYDEAVAVLVDTETFSSCNCVGGPFPGLPFEPEGDDIRDLVEQHRYSLPMGQYLVALDPPEHTRQRLMLKKLFTPNRMKENEAYMWGLADRLIDEFIGGGGRFEVLADYANAFTLLSIADLLGMPEEDRQLIRKSVGVVKPSSGGDRAGRSRPSDPLEFLAERFTAYIEDRRREPRDDVLTGVANATYPDGTTPEVDVVVRAATFLFAAGQDTTTRLIQSGLRILAERPDVQDYLRADRERIANFVEEALRFETPSKVTFRLARRSTTLAGVEIPAGTTVMIAFGAANRDPRRFEAPLEFRPDRSDARGHMSFGRGIHSCIGGPLARIETRIAIERLLARTSELRIDESEHGPEDARRYDWERTYILRGMTSLHLEFTPQ